MRSKSEIEREYYGTYDQERSNALGWILNATDPITSDEYIPKGDMATEQEIKDCISKLKAEQKNVPHYSLFGDDNWGTTDTWVEALEWALRDK